MTQKVGSQTGRPVAGYKTVDTKLAMEAGIIDAARKDKVRSFPADGAALADAPVSWIRGVGAHTAEELHQAHGIDTVGQLAAFNKPLSGVVLDELSTEAQRHLGRARAHLVSPKANEWAVDAQMAAKGGAIDPTRARRWRGAEGDRQFGNSSVSVLKGIGDSTRDYLALNGVTTVSDLARADLGKIFAYSPAPDGSRTEAQLRNVQSALHSLR